MGLIQVATATVTSAVASVTLTGIDDDSVYMVTHNNWSPVDDTVVCRFRVTKSGTAQSDANYDSASKSIASDTSFGNSALSEDCLLYTSPSPRDGLLSRMPSSA